MSTPKKKQESAYILEPFEEKWVALSPDQTEVVASGENLEEVEDQLGPDEIRHVIFMKVPSSHKIFIPHLA
jgi:hypothetical protein